MLYINQIAKNRIYSDILLKKEKKECETEGEKAKKILRKLNFSSSKKGE